LQKKLLHIMPTLLELPWDLVRSGMKNLEFCMDYDEGADVLYISIGKPRPGYGDMIDDVVVIRRDFSTHEVIVLVWTTTFLLFASSSFGVFEDALSDFV